VNASRITRRQAALALLAAAVAPGVRASRVALPGEVARLLPGALLIGEGRLRYLGLHVYDIRLWAPNEQVARSPELKPLALELEYARALGGKAIAERSLKEMQGLDSVDATQAQRWLAQMQRIFPDVKAGDRITGVQQPGEAALFFVNGDARGEVRDAEFVRLFFGIWLSPRTSQPRLREALLGTRGNAS
jgi:hypothetical protein